MEIDYFTIPGYGQVERVSLELTGEDEPKGLYQAFFGAPVNKIFPLIMTGYKPISVSDVIERRLSAPDNARKPWLGTVRKAWQRSFISTGDMIAYDVAQKNVKIVLNAKLVSKIEPGTTLSDCAHFIAADERRAAVPVWAGDPCGPGYSSPRAAAYHKEYDAKYHKDTGVLSNEQWEDLCGDDVLCLSADKIEKAHEKGIVRRNGVWQPENTVVGDIWEGTNTFPGLARGKNLKDYAEMTGYTYEGDNAYCHGILGFWFCGYSRYYNTSPIMQFLRVSTICESSRVYGYDTWDYRHNPLVGVATEPHVAHEKVKELEALVQSAHIKREALDRIEAREAREWHKKIRLQEEEEYRRRKENTVHMTFVELIKHLEL